MQAPYFKKLWKDKRLKSLRSSQHNFGQGPSLCPRSAEPSHFPPAFPAGIPPVNAWSAQRRCRGAVPVPKATGSAGSTHHPAPPPRCWPAARCRCRPRASGSGSCPCTTSQLSHGGMASSPCHGNGKREGDCHFLPLFHGNGAKPGPEEGLDKPPGCRRVWEGWAEL